MPSTRRPDLRRALGLLRRCAFSRTILRISRVSRRFVRDGQRCGSEAMLNASSGRFSGRGPVRCGVVPRRLCRLPAAVAVRRVGYRPNTAMRSTRRSTGISGARAYRSAGEIGRLARCARSGRGGQFRNGLFVAVFRDRRDAAESFAACRGEPRDPGFGPRGSLYVLIALPCAESGRAARIRRSMRCCSPLGGWISSSVQAVLADGMSDLYDAVVSRRRPGICGQHGAVRPGNALCQPPRLAQGYEPRNSNCLPSGPVACGEPVPIHWDVVAVRYNHMCWNGKRSTTGSSSICSSRRVPACTCLGSRWASRFDRPRVRKRTDVRCPGQRRRVSIRLSGFAVRPSGRSGTGKSLKKLRTPAALLAHARDLCPDGTAVALYLGCPRFPVPDVLPGCRDTGAPHRRRAEQVDRVRRGTLDVLAAQRSERHSEREGALGARSGHPDRADRLVGRAGPKALQNAGRGDAVHKEPVARRTPSAICCGDGTAAAAPKRSQIAPVYAEQ